MADSSELVENTEVVETTEAVEVERATAARSLAPEVRAWLLETDGTGFGSRGRISLASHRAYLEANEGRAREIAKDLGLMPKNNHLNANALDAVALKMAHPNKPRRVAEPVAEEELA